jgi:hypothetical protein
MAVLLKSSLTFYIEDSTQSPTECFRKVYSDTTGIAITEYKAETIVIATATDTELDFGGVASAMGVFVRVNKACTYSLDTTTPGADANPLPINAWFFIKSPTASGLVNITLTTSTTDTTVDFFVAG